MIELRPAEKSDYAFALNLYLETMEPYTSKLMSWDEQLQIASFARHWKLDDAQIISLEGADVGWLQSEHSPREIILHQFFVEPGHQRRGIGTAVLGRLLEVWATYDKPIILRVLRNNPARRLYERTGFQVIREVGVKFEMRWMA